jgi:Tol biopolymer transport system component
MRNMAVPGRFSVATLVVGVVSLALGAAGSAAAAVPNTELVSIALDGSTGDAPSVGCSVSAHGRYVAFISQANNLVPGDPGAWEQVFLRYRKTGTTAQVDVSDTGAPPNGSSNWLAVSDTGRFIAFDSSASNLVRNDFGTFTDVFVRDRVTGHTRMVSVRTDLTAGGNGVSMLPSISADGRFVAFTSSAGNLIAGDTNGEFDIFVRDLDRGRTVRVSRRNAGGQANGSSFFPSISADGRYVAFESSATNLVPGDTNHRDDVFVRDLVAQTTERVSVSSAGDQENDGALPQRPVAISADGRFVAFLSAATNLVADDTNGTPDVFVHDRLSGATTRVSVSSTGRQSRNQLLSGPVISGDGSVVAFGSSSSNLVTDDTNSAPDVFLHSTTSGATTRVSVTSAGAEANDESAVCGLSRDGLHVGFNSGGDNLADADTNDSDDMFIRNLG